MTRLYHGTGTWQARCIMKQGIHPRGRTKGNWQDTVPSNSNAVYLTTAYPLYHAIARIPSDRLNKTGRRKHQDTDEPHCAVVEIETDRLPSPFGTFNMVPDEDALEQLARANGDHTAEQMVAETKRHRDALGAHRGTDNWQVSLQALGTCAHMGEIPLEAVTRIFWLRIDKMPQLSLDAMDAVTTIKGFRFAGHRHWAMMAASLLGMSNEEIDAGLKDALDPGIYQALPVDFDLLDIYRKQAIEGVAVQYIEETSS